MKTIAETLLIAIVTFFFFLRGFVLNAMMRLICWIQACLVFVRGCCHTKSIPLGCDAQLQVTHQVNE